jgi:hypothetical protein
MGKDPDRIRQDIEETRSQMDNTVDAIGYKADVKGRVKGSLADKRDAVTETAGTAVSKVTGAADSVVSKVSGAVPNPSQVRRGARRTAGLAQENPLGVAIGGAALGFLVGLVAPSSRVEDEKMGSLADDVKDRAAEARTEAIERGKLVGEEALASVSETVKETGQEQGEDLAESVKESAHEIASGSGSESRPS